MCGQCPILGVPTEKFTTWKAHLEHINQFHNGVVKYMCGFCGVNTFDTEEEKIGHKYFCRIAKAQGKMKPIPKGSSQCTLCEIVISPNSQRKTRDHF